MPIRAEEAVGGGGGEEDVAVGGHGVDRGVRRDGVKDLTCRQERTAGEAGRVSRVPVLLLAAIARTSLA
jgi:hypothetical protein